MKGLTLAAVLIHTSLFNTVTAQNASDATIGVNFPTAAAAAAPPATSVVYSGGHVLQNPTIQPIYWGHKTAGHIVGLVQPPMDLFYSEIVGSSYLLMPEYQVQEATFNTSYFYEMDNGAVLDDTLDIQPFLIDLAKKGIIHPNQNTYYPVYVRVAGLLWNNLESCTDFCYYRNSVTYAKGQTIYYGVFPLYMSFCTPCTSISQIANLIINSAMALASAVTNPEASSSSSASQASLGYVDSVSGVGIGELCRTVRKVSKLEEVFTTNGRYFQLPPLWSEKLQGCTANFQTLAVPVAALLGAPTQ
ncbi:hypothetical protein HDU77_004426 [Chytriomyces hyalinus]|nr:hypothetical protein HDU77_004426 [Chytriomyces hyalinus]